MPISNNCNPTRKERIAEVESAAKALAQREADIAAVTPVDFPLPTLGAKLKARVRDEVLNGRGFLLRGGSIAHPAARRPSSTARTSAACPSGLTFGQTWAIRPSGSTRKVRRATPM